MREEVEARVLAILIKRRRPLSVTQIERELAVFEIAFKDFSTLSKGLKSMYLRGLLQLQNPREMQRLGNCWGRPTFYLPTDKGKLLALEYASQPHAEPQLSSETPTTTTIKLEETKPSISI